MPLAVLRLPMTEFQSNCYVVCAEPGASEAAVVDPGGDPAPLLDELERLEARVGGILLTHGDVDHVGGVAELARRTGAEVWAPAGEAETLRAGVTRTGRSFPAHEPEHTVSGGDEIEVAGISFEVLDVPGHSAGHVAYAADGELFSGDLLFSGSVGRVDLPGGDWQALLDSVRRLAERFDPDTAVNPGHGEPTTLGRELETNPYLRELRDA